MPRKRTRRALIRESEETPHIAQILDMLRLIESVLGLQIGLNLGRQPALAGERATRRQLHHNEGDRQHDPDHRAHRE